MKDFTLLHGINVITHIIAGSMALLFGVYLLIVKKGTQPHQRNGRLFLKLTAIVVLTGFLGVLVFGRNLFLLVLTALSGYSAFSGFRTVQVKANHPKLLDVVVALSCLASGVYFLYYIESIGFIWSRGIIYATVGTLFLTVTYDLARFAIPVNTYKHLWLYEHIYKMIATFTALLAAATGTLLPNHKPYSQFLPSVFGTFLAIGFILYFYWKNKKTLK